MDREPIVVLDRNDIHRFEVIINARGIPISVARIDGSVLAYLLSINKIDQGHEGAARTYLDWQYAYTASRGYKTSTYERQAGSGDSADEKAAFYTRLIVKLGRETQKIVEYAIDPENLLIPTLRSLLLSHNGKIRQTAGRTLEPIIETCVPALECLSRRIDEVRKNNACASKSTPID